MTPVQSEHALPDVFGPLLSRLRGDVAELTGDPSARITPTAFQARPFSNVVRLRVADAQGTTLAHWFAKVQIPKVVPDAATHMSRRVRHEFDTTLQVEAALTGQPGIDVLHAITCYPELFAIVTQELRGVTLLAYLEARLTRWSRRSDVTAAEQAVGQTGSWLHRFQQIAQVDEFVAGSDLREYIDHRLQKLVAAGRGPVTAPVRDQLLEHIDRLLIAVAPAELRSVMRHADLAPGNVMVTPNGVAVLDFAMTSRGASLHDLTRLSLQIDLMRAKPHYSPRAIDGVMLALRRGFDATLRPSRPLFRLLTLLHRVNHLGTLTLSPPRGPARLYAGRLRRLHERGLVQEMTTPIEA